MESPPASTVSSPILYFFPKGKGVGPRCALRSVRVMGWEGGGSQKGALTAKRPHLWSRLGSQDNNTGLSPHAQEVPVL